MMKYLGLELYKMKHKGMFLTFLLLLGVELLFVFSNYGRNENFLSMISDPSAPAWEDLIVGPAVLNGLFFSIIVAVLSSRISDMEHMGNTWKLLECNNQSKTSIWFCKYIIVSSFMLVAILIQVISIIYYGKSVGVVAPIPVKTLIDFVVGTAMVTFVVITIQLFLSLMISNQLISMAVGMIGALIGFVSSLLPPIVRNILIWGNYAELMVISQDVSNGDLKNNDLVVRSIDFVPLIIVFIFGIIIFILFFYKFKQKEC